MFSLLRVGVFASYSPDGTRRVSNDQPAAAKHNSIVLMNADGSGLHSIFRDEKKNAMAPAWSHGGDRIAFSLGQFFQILLGPALGDIATIDVDSGSLTILTDGKANYALPSWSPDDKRIVYRRAGPNGNALEIVDVATHEQHELLTRPSHLNQPAWSPTRDRIAFMSDMDGDYELYAIDADGTNLARLTHSPGHDAHESWSPDGEWLAFTSGRGGFKDEALLRVGNPQSYGEICVMRADGSDVRVLTDNPYEDGTPEWIP
jgi:Tol biopolymer transport system component